MSIYNNFQKKMRLSLRTRLLLAVGAVALVALVVASITTYSSLQSFLNNQIDARLQADSLPLQRVLSTGQPVSLSTVSQVAPGAFVEVRNSAGQIRGLLPAIGKGGQLLTPNIPAHINSFGTGSHFSHKNRLFLTLKSQAGTKTPIRIRVSKLPANHELIIGLPLGGTIATLHRLAIVEAIVTLSALVFAIGLGWVLVKTGLKPLRQVEETAMAITGGDIQSRVPKASTKTEVGRLATSFNTMLDRIQDAFYQRDITETALRSSEEKLRRFVADASHELRTPVAAVSAYAELFERGASQHPQDLARAMTGIRKETTRMGTLVEDLLLLARLDEGRPLNLEAVELVSLISEAITAALAVGPEWPIKLQASESIEVPADVIRLRQVIDNLFSNVRAHTPPGTSTVVELKKQNEEALIQVSDNGPGIENENLAKIFERFYRVETSRSRQYGGAGLGLAIVSGIISSHKGRVTVQASLPHGTCFRIWLPLANPNIEKN